MIKKIAFTFFILAISGTLFSQCLTLNDLLPIFKKKQKQQEKYLSGKGYTPLKNNMLDPETFGYEYQSKDKSKKHINIKFHGKNVSMIQFRFGPDGDCFKSCYDACINDGCTQDYQKITAATKYTYYKNSKYGVETAEWVNDGVNYYQFSLINLDNFDVLKHQWDNY